MAKALAARGANLVIIARRYEKLVEVQKAIEAEFGVKIPNRLWKKLSTLGDVLDALQKYGA